MKASFQVQDVKKLEKMGFAAEASTAALAKHKGDLRAAVTELVSAPAPCLKPQPRAWTSAKPPKGAIAGSDRTPRTRFLDAESKAEAETHARTATAPALEARPASLRSDVALGCFRPGETAERLQARLQHQQATLEMLRAAGASDEELNVLLIDAAALEDRITSLRSEQATLAAATAAAEQAAAVSQRGLLAESAARKRRDEAAQAEAAAAQQAAAAAAIAATAEAAAQKLAVVEAEAEAAAKSSRLLEAERLLVVEVAAREQSEADAAAALVTAAKAEKKVEHCVQEGAASLAESLQTWASGRFSVELLEASPSDPDYDGSSHTLYTMLLTVPNTIEIAPGIVCESSSSSGDRGGGSIKPVLLTKRYSEFAALKHQLEAALPLLRTLDFPEKTWTSWGAGMASTIEDRKTRLTGWLNNVLFLHSPDEATPALAAFCGFTNRSKDGGGTGGATASSPDINRELAG